MRIAAKAPCRRGPLSLNVMPLTSVYRLREDVQRIENIQRATLTTEEFGLQQTHGLFGSPEWWQNIERGALSLHTARGCISKVYMGSMGDWPEFKMLTSEGVELTWTRSVSRKEFDALFREGAAVEVDYVVQTFKPKSWGGASPTNCVVEVRVEPGA
jgi:hypothetical protein